MPSTQTTDERKRWRKALTNAVYALAFFLVALVGKDQHQPVGEAIAGVMAIVCLMVSLRTALGVSPRPAQLTYAQQMKAIEIRTGELEAEILQLRLTGRAGEPQDVLFAQDYYAEQAALEQARVDEVNKATLAEAARIKAQRDREVDYRRKSSPYARRQPTRDRVYREEPMRDPLAYVCPDRRCRQDRKIMDMPTNTGGWIVPWALTQDADGKVWVGGHHVYRREGQPGPYGTATVFIWRFHTGNLEVRLPKGTKIDVTDRWSDALPVKVNGKL